MKKYKRLSDIIVIPVSSETYWKVFSEMHENDSLSTISDNRLVDNNLILVRLLNRNKIIAIHCKDKLQTEVHKQFPGTRLKWKKKKI